MNQTMPGKDQAHCVSIEGRSHAVISGVQDVELFSGEKILVVTNQGAIAISGQGMQMENLSISEGNLIISGKIDGIFYDERAPKAKSVFARLFR